MRILIVLLPALLLSSEINFGLTGKKSTTDSSKTISVDGIYDVNISDVSNRISLDYNKEDTDNKGITKFIDSSILSTYSNVYFKGSYIEDTQRSVDKQYKVGSGYIYRSGASYRIGMQYSRKQLLDGTIKNDTYIKLGSLYETKVKENKFSWSNDIDVNTKNSVLFNTDIKYKIPLYEKLHMNLVYKGTYDNSPDYTNLPKYFYKYTMMFGCDF